MKWFKVGRSVEIDGFYFSWLLFHGIKSVNLLVPAGEYGTG
jgi:hypothetical protein